MVEPSMRVTGKAKRSMLRRDICITLVLGHTVVLSFGVFVGRDPAIAAFLPLPVMIVTRILLDRKSVV